MWTGDVAVLADRFSSTTTALVPFAPATITATYSSVTTGRGVRKHLGGGNVLPPTAKPKGYSLTDIAKATAFFATRGADGPRGRSKSNEPNVPFQILYDSNINEPHNTFSVRPGTMLYVPIFFVSDAPPAGNFPDVDDRSEIEHYIFSDEELGAQSVEIEVDGKITSIVGDSADPRYIVGVATEPLADGGTHYITGAVFLTPLTKGTHTITIRATFTGAVVGGLFEFEIPYTVIVDN
jgi:hypothetical protein